MICGTCRGDGHIILKIEKEDGSREFIPETCPECMGVGEILSEVTSTYPDSKGDDNYD